jgi:hypothetical protein
VAVALQDVAGQHCRRFLDRFLKSCTPWETEFRSETHEATSSTSGSCGPPCWKPENWVSRDLYNGRIVRIPNSTVLRGSVFNYSQGFRFIWDEIKALLTTTSDCQLAREMLLRVATEAIGEYLLEAQTSWKAMSDDYRSANPPLEPTVALAVSAGSLEFTVSYVVDYTQRTAMQDQLFTKIVAEVANSKGRLQWASPPGTPSTRQPTNSRRDRRAHVIFDPHGAGHAAGSN